MYPAGNVDPCAAGLLFPRPSLTPCHASIRPCESRRQGAGSALAPACTRGVPQVISQEVPISTAGSHVDPRLSRQERRIWDFVSSWPLKSLWNLRGVPVRVVLKRSWKAIMEDHIFGHAAELGFYFL